MIHPAGFDGKPVTATLKQADGTTTVTSAAWNGSGTLSISLSAIVLVNRDVSYTVHMSA